MDHSLRDQDRGRAFQTSGLLDAVTTLEIVPYSDTRTALILGTAGGSVRFSLDKSMTVAGQPTGFVVAGSGPPLVLNKRDHGAIVRGPWFAVSNAGAATWVAVESHLEDIGSVDVIEVLEDIKDILHSFSLRYLR